MSDATDRTLPVWRSALYVPSNVPKFIDGAHKRGADAIIVDLEDSVPMHAVVPRLSGTPGEIRYPAPALGEHNDAILGGLGFSAEALADLRRRKVI